MVGHVVSWTLTTVFLHPAQRQLVEARYAGPARVSGSAGTGKTVVALHRAAFLARTNPDARVLLTTFSETLANALRTQLRRLLANEPRLGERIEVDAPGALGRRLYTAQVGKARLATRDDVRKAIAVASKAVVGHRFSQSMLLSEWEQVIDAWQIGTWEAYRDVVRLGRKTRLPEAQRATMWAIVERARESLREQGLVTQSEMFHALAETIGARRSSPFDFAVVDEAQDLGVAQLRFLAALGGPPGERPDALFLTGDLGQRIFQQPFSWKALGVDVRGRSRTLRVNYRTSHQIRMQADRLLGSEVTDADGIVESRKGTVSVFNGPVPEVRTFASADEESRVVGTWIRRMASEGLLPHEIGIFVRSEAQIDRARGAVKAAGEASVVLDDQVDTAPRHVSISTMHRAKGLEFRAVAVMACDDDVVPLESRIAEVGDEGDLQETYDTERHLLYVACTRARDHLLVTGVEPASEFLGDLGNVTRPPAVR